MSTRRRIGAPSGKRDPRLPEGKGSGGMLSSVRMSPGQIPAVCPAAPNHPNVS
jgi:hypothetical protein